MPTPKKNEAKQDFLKRCTQKMMADDDLSSGDAFKSCNLDWDNANSQRASLALTRPVFFEDPADDNSPDHFMVTAYTGKPLSAWWSDVIIDLAGINTKSKIPVLREHARDRVVGFGKSSRNEVGFYVAGEFSRSTDDAKEVRALADEGYPWQASISVSPLNIKVLADAKAKETVNGREISGPMEIWTKSDVGEVSFVSLGRDDDTAAISLTASDEKTPVIIEPCGALPAGLTNPKTEESIMKITTPIQLEMLQEEAPELLAAIREEAGVSVRETAFTDGVTAERTRVMEIINAGADETQMLTAIKDGISADAAYKAFFMAEKQKRAAGLADLEAQATKPLETEDPAVTPVETKTAEEIRASWRPVIGPAAA